MAIIKSPKQKLWALRRENATLRAELARQRELTAFVALAAVGLDLEALTAEEEADDGAV